MSTRSVTLLVGPLLAIVIYFAIFTDKTYFTDLLNKYNLLPKPEAFTELYFEDHTTLPTVIQPEEEYTFKFTVHNLEYKPFTYNYTVTAEASGSATLLNKGVIHLNHDEYKTITGTYSTPEPALKNKISVELEEKNQAIHFWVNN